MANLFRYLKIVGSSRYGAIFWTILLVVLHCIPGSSIPKADIFEFLSFDKWVHFSLFAVFVFFWAVNRMNQPAPRQEASAVLILFACIAILMGVFLEWVQRNFIPLRAFEVTDMLSDAAGAITAAILLGVYGKRTGLFPRQ
jgi:VanZ family protein